MTGGSLKMFSKTPMLKSKTTRISKLLRASIWSLPKQTRTALKSQTSTRASDTPWKGAPTRILATQLEWAFKISRAVTKRHPYGKKRKLVVLWRRIHPCVVKEFSAASTSTPRRLYRWRLINGWAVWEGTRPKRTAYSRQEWIQGAPTFCGGAKVRMSRPIS